MEVTVNHLGAWQFEVEARGHVVISDQPVEAGGFNEGITPPELLLASLGSCAGYYAAEYLKRNQLAGEGTRVRVTAEKAKNPARLDQFRIEVEARVPLTFEHRKGVEQAIKRCIVHNTLMHPPKVVTTVLEPAAATRRSAPAA